MSPDTGSNGSQPDPEAAQVEQPAAVEQSGNNAKLVEAAKYQPTRIPVNAKEVLEQQLYSLSGIQNEGLSVSQYLDRLRDQGEFLDTQILRDAGDNVGSLMEGSWTQLEEYLYGVSGVNSAGNGNVFDSDSFWKNVANLREKINDIRHGPVIFGNEVTCFGDWQSRLVTQVLGWISGEKVSDMAMRDRLTCLNQLLVDKGYTFRLGRNEEIVVNEGETWTIREVKTAFSKLGLTPFD